jgi:hypothetical protein
VILFIDSLSEDILRGFANHGNQIPTSILAISDNAGTRRHGTHLPTLADRLRGVGQSLIRTKPIAAPHHFVEVWLEKKRI